MTLAGNVLSAAEGVIVRRGQKVRPASARRKLRRNLGALCIIGHTALSQSSLAFDLLASLCI
eukprot:COSAG01_NODE_13966_length_1507_cov_3.803395_3_plen_62_part_00